MRRLSPMRGTVPTITCTAWGSGRDRLGGLGLSCIGFRAGSSRGRLGCPRVEWSEKSRLQSDFGAVDPIVIGPDPLVRGGVDVCGTVKALRVLDLPLRDR
jgi:hypothetical protein